MKLFLSPHCDDEALFGAYTILRHRPLVVVCFDGRLARHLATPEQREAETVAAMEILGCQAEFLRIPSASDGEDELEGLLEHYDPEWVWAPLPEEDGHAHHNTVGESARRLWPDITTWYATYTLAGGKTEIGDPVPVEDGWPELKRQALDCYVSQIARAGTRTHFERSLDEYLTDPALVTA